MGLPFLPPILSFLTPLDILRVRRVSRAFLSAFEPTCGLLTHLDLACFWYVLGSAPLADELVIQIVSLCYNMNSVSLAFCSMVNDALLERIVVAVPKKEGVKKLNLYYVLGVTTKVLTNVVFVHFTELAELNIGQCIGLTSPVYGLERMGSLQRLIVANNSNLKDDDLAAIELLEGLKIVDMTGCTGFTEVMVGEMKRAKPTTLILGPEINSQKPGERRTTLATSQ